MHATGRYEPRAIPSSPPRNASSIDGARRRRRALLMLAPALLIAGLVGCRGGRVSNTGSYAPQSSLSGVALQRPALVVVDTFAIDPSEVKLDSGVGAQIQREMSGVAPDAARAQIAHQVRGAFTDTLVERLHEMGFRTAVGGSGQATSGSVVTVRGQVLDVDQGNRTRRLLIGFGAGKSDLGADVQLYYADPGSPPALWQTFSADINSGHMPGLAAGAGAGAASGNVGASLGLGAGLHASSESRDSAAGQAKALAGTVADSLQAVFARQGWTSGS